MTYIQVNLKESLSNDHKDVFVTLYKIEEGLKNGELDLDLFEEFERKLKDHIYTEETLVFPMLLTELDLRKEVSGFEMEHAAMWRLIDLINKEIDEKKFEKTLKYFDEIDRILKNHNEREEEYIYSKIEEGSVQKKSKRPENWKCTKFSK